MIPPLSFPELLSLLELPEPTITRIFHSCSRLARVQLFNLSPHIICKTVCLLYPLLIGACQPRPTSDTIRCPQSCWWVRVARDWDAPGSSHRITRRCPEDYLGHIYHLIGLPLPFICRKVVILVQQLIDGSNLPSAPAECRCYRCMWPAEQIDRFWSMSLFGLFIVTMLLPCNGCPWFRCRAPSMHHQPVGALACWVR